MKLKGSEAGASSARVACTAAVRIGSRAQVAWWNERDFDLTARRGSR